MRREHVHQGKTITLLVGASPGCGYDGDARMVARHTGATSRACRTPLWGYTGSGTVLLTVEKGEVQGIANHSISNILAKHSDWLNEHKINILFQTGEQRSQALLYVPLASDIALNAEKREVLHL